MTEIPLETDVLAGIFAFPRLVLERGEGSWVWDVEGKKYLDYTAGLGVMALGHGRQDLGEIFATQYARLGHVSNLFGNLPQLQLAREIIARSFATRVWFQNSGTEANEAALKFARLHGRSVGGDKKHVIVAMKHGFHGRTYGALSATHHPAYRTPFAPLVGGVRFASFNDSASVEKVMDARVAAVIVEPVQGEGGVLPATQEFLEALRRLCDQHQALLIYDEVQCGLGRTGKLFAYQSYGVTPDMLTLAKPLAAGLPLGAVLLNDRVAKVLQPGHHGSTFAGGPAVSAVALQVLEQVSAPALLKNVADRAAQLAAGLAGLTSGIFSEARGLGLMQALVVASPKKTPPADVVKLCRARGLLVTRAGDDAVRLLPPLVTSSEEIAFCLAVLAEVEKELAPKRKSTRKKASEKGAGAQP